MILNRETNKFEPEYERDAKGNIKTDKETGEPLVVKVRPPMPQFSYEYGGFRYEFTIPEGLGANDLRVLQGLIAISGGKTVLLGKDPVREDAKQLRLLLDPSGESDEPGLYVRETYYRLAQTVGMKSPGSGGVAADIRECIERMFKVTIIVRNLSTGESKRYHLISAFHDVKDAEIDPATKLAMLRADGMAKKTNRRNSRDKEPNSLVVSLNPIIAAAVVGDQYTRIEMAEVRALSRDGARLIHQRLCAQLNPGHSNKFGLETLANYVWTNTIDITPRAWRKRLDSVREFLDELVGLGWEIEFYKNADKKDIANIRRPGRVTFVEAGPVADVDELELAE